jgi:hypothetical protein
MTEYRYKWQEKFETGEFISEWNGYIPFYAGCFYGSEVVLGGEERYKHCYDFFSGIGDVEWWDKTELDKLTQEEQDDLLRILKRNKQFDEYKNKIATSLAQALNVEGYQIHRVPNKDLRDFLLLVHLKSNNPNETPKWEVIEND